MPVPDAETTVPRYTTQCIACDTRIDGRRAMKRKDQCPNCSLATTSYEGGAVFHVYRSGDHWVIRDSVTGLVTQGESKTHALEMFADAMGYRNRSDDIDFKWVAALDDEIGDLAKPSDRSDDHVWNNDVGSWSRLNEQEESESD